MNYQISGTVTSSSSEYFSCLNFSKLKLRVFKVGFDSLTDIGNSTIGSDGTFNFEVINDAEAVIVKLFYIKAAPVEIFVSQSETFCHHDNINVYFSFDEIGFTDPLFAAQNTPAAKAMGKEFSAKNVIINTNKNGEVDKISIQWTRSPQ